jgi:methyl-accepting chemotaxis protein
MSKQKRSFAFAATRGGRLPVGFQVLAVIGVLFAVLLASIVVVVMSLISLGRDQAELQDNDVPYAVAIATAALNAKAMANHERGYLISGSKEFLEEFDRNLVNVRSAFAAASMAAEGDRQVDAASKAHAGFEQWVFVVRAQFKTYQAGNRRAATRAALGPGRTLRKNYEASFADAQSVARRAIELRNNPFARTEWVTVLLISLLLVLAICVGLTLWLMRTLNTAFDVEEAPEPAADPIPLSAGARRSQHR